MFGDQQGQSLLLYLDDIVVYSSSVEQHLQRLEMVLGRLQKEGLKAKLEKCAFFKQEVGYLGHVISSQGVAPPTSSFVTSATQSVVSVLPSNSAAELQAMQEADPLLKDVLVFWRRKALPTPMERQGLPKSAMALFHQWDRLVEKDGVLFCKVFRSDGGKESLQLILPADLKQEILSQLHQEHGHQGIERTTGLVRQCCYWPGMSSEIKQSVLGCQHCQVAKDSGHRSHSFIGHLLAS